MRRTISTVHIAIAIVMVLSASLILGNRALAATPHRATFAGGSVTFATWDSNPTEKAAQQKLVANFQSKYNIHVNLSRSRSNQRTRTGRQRRPEDRPTPSSGSG